MEKKISFTYPDGFNEAASYLGSLAAGASLSGNFTESDTISEESKRIYLAGFISSIILM